MKKTKKLNLLNYKTPYCIKRSKTQKRNAVVDSHFHMRPFGGSPIEIKKMINILKRSGILFVEIEGIGQKILNNPKCTYYKDCAKSIVKNTISNDILNAQLLIDNNLLHISGIKINLSMTFPDLSKPKEIIKGIHYLDKEYPSLFNWMGELNVVKQSLFIHKVKPISLSIIPQWKYFMKILRDRRMPLSLHCDLGNNADNFKYLPLMERILFLYPKNIIVWVHLGLSKELTNIDPKKHTELLDSFLTKYKNLYFDISWRLLYDQVFHDTQKKIYYVELMNKFPERFLTGTDFVNSITKNEKIYKEELRITSLIVNDLNNKAFRQIALGQNYLDLIHSKYKAPYICKTLKQRRLKKKTYKKKQGGRYKEMWCSQAIVSEPLTKSVKICRKKKEDIAIEKEMAKLNKQYDAFLAKTCKADDYDCIQKHRDGNPLFDHLIKLEAKSGKMRDACINKYCNRKELDRLLHDCIDLGEEQCRVKYADLIKKSKKKILPLDVCMRNI